MESRDNNTIQNVENRPARQFMEMIRKLIGENEVYFTERKWFERSKAKTRLDALMHAYHALSMQVLSDELARPSFIMSEEMINAQSSAITETLAAEKELNAIASGAAIRHWEEVSSKALLSLRNAQLDNQRRMTAETINLYRQLRDADAILAEKKSKQKKAERGCFAGKKRLLAKEAVSKQEHIVENIEAALVEHHELPKVREFQALYDQAIGNAKYHVEHQESMRQAAAERLMEAQRARQRVVDHIAESEVRYYGTLTTDMIMKLVRLYQLSVEFQQAAMIELELKLKPAVFADYKKRAEDNSQNLAALMQKLWCDGLGNKNAATIHRERAAMTDKERDHYSKQDFIKPASVVPVTMFKAVTKAAPETLEKRKYLTRDPGAAHQHAVYKI